MPMTVHQVHTATAITDATKDKVLKAKLPGSSTGDAENFVAESYRDGVLTLAKAPDTNN